MILKTMMKLVSIFENETQLALPAPEKVLLLPTPVEPQPKMEEAPVAKPEVKIENGKEVIYQNNIVKRNNYKKLTNRRQGNKDEYGNARKPRNLDPKWKNTQNKNYGSSELSADDLRKAVLWFEKIKSGEWGTHNLKPDQIIRIHDTWKVMNSGKVPTIIEKLYNEMILGIK